MTLDDLILLYAEELVAEAANHNRGWLLHGQDTPMDKAVRVAEKTRELIANGNACMVAVSAAPWQRVAARLGVTIDTAYLNGSRDEP